MKKIVFFIISSSLFICNIYSQDLINPYLPYQGILSTDLKIISNSIYYVEEQPALDYNGEYEILLDESNPWGNEFCGNPSIAPFNFDNFALSYQIELVSFPFSIDCAFPSLGDLDGGCALPSGSQLPSRELNVPADLLMNPSSTYWDYPYNSSSTENSLWRITSRKKFNRNQFKQFAFSTQDNPNSLVTASYLELSGAGSPHNVLPHSILKHTVNIHCGNDIELQSIISSFSWYSDLTRGRMREYPFHYGSIGSVNLQASDIITRPEFFNFGIYSQSDNSQCGFPRIASGFSCNGVVNLEGFPINYTPFDPVLDDQCGSYIPPVGSINNAEYGNFSCFQNGLFCIPLQDYTIIASTAPKNYIGTTLAGYEIGPGGILRLIDPNPPIVHKYYIDKNITLDWINHSELTIYNPSEVYITADNLKFPTNYTFKTIRGVYPYASEVDAANTPANGGPFTDPTKRDVPVETDLYKDFHVDPQYPSNDHKYASIYHLLSGSKLTIEPCVKIFDATFEINPGSEIVFQDWSTNQINVQRYQLLFKGGIVTKRDQSFLMQNENETDKALNWEGGDYIAAGANVDVNKDDGEYTIENNAHVTFEATNYIDIKSGFYAKDKSEFEASIKPVIIPPCGPMRIRNPRNNNSADLNNTSGIGYFTVSPNPAIDNSYFMFEVFEKSNARIIIYDSMGKIIQQVGENSLLPSGKYSFKFQSENLSPGIYFAKLITMDSQKSIKFIKQ